MTSITSLNGFLGLVVLCSLHCLHLPLDHVSRVLQPLISESVIRLTTLAIVSAFFFSFFKLNKLLMHRCSSLFFHPQSLNDDYSNVSVTLGCLEFTPLFVIWVLSLLFSFPLSPFLPLPRKRASHFNSAPRVCLNQGLLSNIRYYSTYSKWSTLCTRIFSLLFSSQFCSLLFVHFTLFYSTQLPCFFYLYSLILTLSHSLSFSPPLQPILIRRFSPFCFSIHSPSF